MTERAITIKIDQTTDRHLDVLRPVHREGSYQGETKCIPTTTQGKTVIHNLIHNPPLRIWRKFGNLKKKFNEPGRQKVGRCRSPVRRHSMQSYIRTYYRLRKREPLIALGSHQVGGGDGGVASFSNDPEVCFA